MGGPRSCDPGRGGRRGARRGSRPLRPRRPRTQDRPGADRLADAKFPETRVARVPSSRCRPPARTPGPPGPVPARAARGGAPSSGAAPGFCGLAPRAPPSPACSSPPAPGAGRAHAPCAPPPSPKGGRRGGGRGSGRERGARDAALRLRGGSPRGAVRPGAPRAPRGLPLPPGRPLSGVPVWSPHLSLTPGPLLSTSASAHDQGWRRGRRGGVLGYFIDVRGRENNTNQKGASAAAVTGQRPAPPPARPARETGSAERRAEGRQSRGNRWADLLGQVWVLPSNCTATLCETQKQAKITAVFCLLQDPQPPPLPAGARRWPQVAKRALRAQAGLQASTGSPGVYVLCHGAGVLFI